jgi:hypothetical protein
MNTLSTLTLRIYVVVCLLGITSLANAQDSIGSSSSRNTYRPHAQRMMETDTVRYMEEVSEPNVEDRDLNVLIDTATKENIENQDSIDARNQYIQDSIAARILFVQDSIIAREKFVRDSLIRRQQVVDSLFFLKKELPQLMGALVKSIKDEIVIKSNRLEVIGDSILNNYSYIQLPFKFNEPYKPWEEEINFSTNPAKLEIDSLKLKITGIQASGINHSFDYGSGGKVLVITGQGLFASKYVDKFYKVPIDSVFFGISGEVIKVKRYFQLYQATNTFQRGSFLFNFLYQVKQYDYYGGELSVYESVKFCDRWAKTDPVKVCNIARYTLTKQGYSYVVKRQNDPVNDYSDGTFTYEFDNLNSLKSVSFINFKNTENWKTFIEQNADGDVSRYVYQNGGVVNRTLLVNYYLEDPKAKYKVETVTCTFEDDGISYYQRNNTTEKARIRDKFTGEWGPWE